MSDKLNLVERMRGPMRSSRTKRWGCPALQDLHDNGIGSSVSVVFQSVYGFLIIGKKITSYSSLDSCVHKISDSHLKYVCIVHNAKND